MLDHPTGLADLRALGARSVPVLSRGTEWVFAQNIGHVAKFLGLNEATGPVLTPAQLVARYRRALSEKRRFSNLRKATVEVLAKIRYLNQVSISMRAGLLDVDGAAREIDATEQQLHELVDRLRNLAGVED